MMTFTKIYSLKNFLQIRSVHSDCERVCGGGAKNLNLSSATKSPLEILSTPLSRFRIQSLQLNQIFSIFRYVFHSQIVLYIT